MKPYRLILSVMILLTLAVPSLMTHAAATRISFTPGATSAFLRQYTLPANSSVDYVLRAGQGQRMFLGVFTATNASIGITVWGVDDGKVLAQGAVNNWNGVLPKTQDYVIRLSNSGGQVLYDLTVTIPARIQFARGAYSATVDGYVATQTRVTYVLWAAKGQTMTVYITAPNNLVGLAIYDPSGQPLKRYEVGGASATVVLPANGDYYLEAVSLSQTTATYFSLYVSIV
jgi:hypothetical protein